MQFPEFDPVLFSIGPLDIRWYALAYVAGIVLGWWYCARLVKANTLWQPAKPPVTTLQLDDLVLWITLGIILGGRFGYALFYQPQLYGQLFTGADWGERLALLRLWDGGMSFHGGLIGVSLAIVWFARRNKVRLLSLGDLVAPVVPIGLFFEANQTIARVTPIRPPWNDMPPSQSRNSAKLSGPPTSWA